jgi:hypothetical protein
MRFGTLLLHAFTLTSSDHFHSLSMESRAPKLPLICLPCYQFNCAVHARIPLHAVLVWRWQGKDSGRFSTGCCQRQSHGGCQGCAGSKSVDQVVLYGFLSYPNHLEVCTYRARTTPEGPNPITLRSENKDTLRGAFASSPKAVVCVAVTFLFLLPSTLGKHLPFVHFCDLPPFHP